MEENKTIFADIQDIISDDSIVIGLFEAILQNALTNDILDIHIDVRSTGSTIRMRKNGKMLEYTPKPNNPLSYTETFNLCKFLYNVLAPNKSVSFNPSECQNVEINYIINGQELKIRCQSVPSYPEGFTVVLLFK